jgi:SAM-dependent methyltransferase
MAELPQIRAAVLDRLIRAGGEAWDELRARTGPRHHLFVPCDQRDAYEALRRLRPRAATFLELGSGAGVVTILADLLGYEAYGIEIDPWLVQRSIQLAEQFDSQATFAEGSFVPEAYQDEAEHLDSERITVTGGACAYDELGLDLADFDLVFGYPWPGEEAWLHTMVQRHARRSAILLTYDSRDGFVETVIGGD